MGQPITVAEKPTARPGIVRFELNRSLSGMGHERYRADQPVTGHRPVDELARRLLDTGEVDAVHIYSNEVTVDLRKGHRGDGLLPVVEELFRYYPDDDAAPVDAAPADAAAVDAAPAEAAPEGDDAQSVTPATS